jgi:hypothetical protein
MTPEGPAPHVTARRVQDHPVPPPLDPPLAGEAPPRLTAFIYYLVRDLLPPRYIGSIAHAAQNASYEELGAMDKGLVDYADRMARRLMHGYEPTGNGQ